MRSSLRFKLLFCLVGVALAVGSGLGVFHALSRNPQVKPVVEARQSSTAMPAAGIRSDKKPRLAQEEDLDSILLMSSVSL